MKGRGGEGYINFLLLKGEVGGDSGFMVRDLYASDSAIKLIYKKALKRYFTGSIQIHLKQFFHRILVFLALSKELPCKM